MKRLSWLSLIPAYVLLCLPFAVFSVGCSDLSHGDVADWWLMPVSVVIAFPIYYISKWLMRVGASR